MSKITAEVISSFQPARVFHSNENIINSMDFSADGNYLITASDDESMKLYNIEKGTEERVLYSKKYGVDFIRFTHGPKTVICASKNKWDDTIRYLSLHDNRYLRYFKGHRDRVVSLHMCPINDSFISSSLDGTVRLWDLATNSCQGILRLERVRSSFVQKPSVASFGPAGLIMTVATGNMLKLYDTRYYDKGPFTTFTMQYQEQELNWNNVKFSNDGKLLLLTTSKAIIIVDSFEGHLVQYIPIQNQHNYPLEASFSPDGEFVLCGTENGVVNVWNSKKGNLIAVWRGETPHPGPVGRVLFNPKKMMAVSSCSQLAFWLPNLV